METIGARIFLGLIVGIAALAAVLGIVGQVLEARRKRKAEWERKHHPWDPLICSHEWEACDAGTCEKGVADPEGDGKRPTWEVKRCTHCGTLRFTCSYGKCPHRKECRAAHEAGSPESVDVKRELIDRIADAHGFEYAHYQMHDRFGNSREAWCRIVPTTIAFSCPDCGGMVVGADTRRVWPGTAGREPTAFRCEQCGRQEDHEFGVPRVTVREGNPQFYEPTGAQPACPRGGKHEWELVQEWTETEFPEGVDSCLENMCLMEEAHYQVHRCVRCGEEKTTRS